MNALLRYARRAAARRRGRTVLAFAGVAVGVAAMASISIATAAASAAYADMYTELAGRAALEIRAEGVAGFDASTVETATRVEGVRATSPTIQALAAWVAPGPRSPVTVLGVEPERDVAVHPFTVAQGEATLAGEGVYLTSALAAAQGVRVGESVRLVTPVGLVTPRVAGLLDPEALRTFPAGVVVARLAAAQRWFALEGRVDSVALVVDDDADLDVVAARVRAGLPPGLRVAPPSARGGLAAASLRSADQGLSAMSLMSLVASVFVVMNAFGMSLAERRRDLATLRALGARPRAILHGLLVEGAVLGVAGTLVGLVAGIFVARGLSVGLSRMLAIHLPVPRPTLSTLVPAAVLGPLATLASVWVPARRAARRDPLADLLGVPAAASDAVPRGTPLAGLLLAAMAPAAAFCIETGRLPPEIAPVAVALGLLGAALLFPLALPPLRRAAIALLSPFVGTAGRIGLREGARRPVQASLTSTVVFVAVLAGVAMGNEILCGVDDVRAWADRALVEDFFVRAVMPDTGTTTAVAVPARVGEEIAALPGVAHVNRIRFLPSTAGGAPVLVIAHTFPPGKPLALDVRDSGPAGLPTRILPDEAIVATALARRMRLAPGDTVEIATRDGPARLRVIATVTEYTSGGDAVYVDWDFAARAFGERGADAYLVGAKEGRRDEVGRALAPLAAREGLMLQSQAELHRAVDGMVDGIVGLLWLVLAIVFVVAALGVVNTLTTHVLDRTRELGVLRAVGTTRGQMRTLVLAEALALAGAALPPGVTVGLALSRLINGASEAVRGFPVPFQIHGGLVLTCSLVAITVAALSSVGPARRASHLEILRAVNES